MESLEKRLLLALVFALFSCQAEDNSSQHKKDVDQAQDSGSAQQAVEEISAQRVTELYQQSCIACHASGAAGAPKTHDVASWAPRMAQGRASVMNNMLKGIGGMPPRGLCANCSEEELWAISEFMAAERKGD